MPKVIHVRFPLPLYVLQLDVVGKTTLLLYESQILKGRKSYELFLKAPNVVDDLVIFDVKQAKNV